LGNLISDSRIPCCEDLDVISSYKENWCII